MGRIVVLPAAVQGQIAAGEVIERPASVVKELVENALDAGARRVEVHMSAGGLREIVVTDDGQGMAEDDAEVAFARHATSKLQVIHDLDAVGTFGFRGEALTSIASVADVRLVTRHPGAGVATVVEASAAGVRRVAPEGAPEGTRMTVRNLFENVPARRKFLKSAQTEVGHTSEWLQRLSVLHPGVGFFFTHEARTVLELAAVGDLDQRIAQLWGPARARALVPIEVSSGGYQLTGRLGPPRETLSSPRLLWTFVGLGDGVARWVRDKLLLRAVLDGYESLVMRGNYPMAIVALHAPCGEVDVNVHPAKLEVRFRQTSAVHQLIAPAIRRRLADALRPDPGPGFQSKDAPTAVAAEPDLPWEPEASNEPTSPPALIFRPPAETGIRQPDAAADLGQSSLWRPAPQGYASLRFVGQVFDGYLLCEGQGRLVLIDQHAAHERVAFERLRIDRLGGRIARDPLLVPEAVALAPAEVATLADHGSELEAVGLEGEPFGDGTYLLRTTPQLLRGHDVGALLRRVAAELNEEGATTAAHAAIDHVLATIACHSVVRVGQRLTEEGVRALLVQMDGVDINAHCPHGRPVSVELTRAQVESLFRR